MIKNAIAKVVDSINLTEHEMIEVMDEIMSGKTTDAQIGSFITALRMKGETIEEITGAAKVMREKATRVTPCLKGEILADTCGTGGDSSGTFNVSTTAAFVLAASGIPVAKHGNRSVSSHCGSADVLEALGVDLNLSPARIGQCIEEIGIGFMFAPMLHGAMKYAIGPRREMGIRTIFNILGPMTNPAGANVQLIGVFDENLVEKLAHVLGKLGTRRALVVCGEGGLDEITLTGRTLIADTQNGYVKTFTVTPEELHLDRCTLEDISGGKTAEESAHQVLTVLGGASGARKNMVLANAGAAIMASGITGTIQDGIQRADELIKSGAAREKLDKLVAFCKKN